MRKPLPPLSHTTGEPRSFRALIQEAGPGFLEQLQISYPRIPSRVELYVCGKWRATWVM